MADDYFTTAVHSLRKPQDKRKLLQILIVIRKHIHDPSPRLQKFKVLSRVESIKNLLGCLRLENNGILDITLSILGNCCINPDFARNSMKLDILHYLDRILEKHDKDSVIGRVFRIVGNLSDHICSAMIIGKEPLLINKVIGFLNRVAKPDSSQEISEATVLMALRTVRKLLKTSTLESLVKTHQALKAVGAVLIKRVAQWEANKHNINLIEEILKVIHFYSRYYCRDMIRSLKNTENGDALVSLGKLIVLYPHRVTAIIENLSKSSSLRSDLPISDMWQLLLEKIGSDMQETNYVDYLRSMCQLADSPANRTYIKLDNSIGQLVNTLKYFAMCTDFSMYCCTLIICILNKFEHDDSPVPKQISADVVNVLISKLEWTDVSSSRILVHRVKKKRKSGLSRNQDNKKLKLIDLDSYDAFPHAGEPREERCVSPSQSSEISSNGPFSPRSATNTEDLSDSDNYSPVCSDVEDADINSLPSLPITDAECVTASDDDDALYPNGRIKHKLLSEIHALLERYSRIKEPTVELGTPNLLITLVNIVLTNEMSPRSRRLIGFILSKPDCLIPLMQTKFVQMMYDLTVTTHNVKNCVFCDRSCEIATEVLELMTKTAESGIGEGNIAHALLRSSTETKNNIVVNIPYIIRNRYLITKLLIKYKGLDVFLDLIEKVSDLQEAGIKSLCILAIRQLKIKNPVHTQPQKVPCDLDADDYTVSETCSNVVTFKVEDGDTISADRDFLSDKSVYFNRLLCGSFKESAQTEITLQNIGAKSLRLLLMLLHSDVASLGVVNLDLDTLLDLLEITERYLLVELNVYLTGCVEQLHMSNKTVPSIYQWSIESGTNILRVETIAFALVGDILDTDRIDMFQVLFGLGYYKQLREDIQNLLVRFLR